MGVMNMPLLQTDPRLAEEPSLAQYGCLAMTLREIAERHARRTLGAPEALEWYRWCVTHGKISDAPGRRAFVLDHAAVINAALYYLAAPQTATYVGALYIEEPERSWGDATRGNYWAAQATFTGYEHSHFYESDPRGYKAWDPYWPHSEMDRILSIRGYQL